MSLGNTQQPNDCREPDSAVLLLTYLVSHWVFFLGSCQIEVGIASVFLAKDSDV